MLSILTLPGLPHWCLESILSKMLHFVINTSQIRQYANWPIVIFTWTLISKDLLNSEYKACVKVSELDSIIFLVYRNPEMLSIQFFLLKFWLWNNIKFKVFICVFTFYCNDAKVILILFYWSCYWILNMINIYWFIAIF